MDVLRTPDDRFVDLPDRAFVPRYVEVDSGDGGRVRVQSSDEIGSCLGSQVLRLHRTGKPDGRPDVLQVGAAIRAPTQMGLEGDAAPDVTETPVALAVVSPR
jgi:hypothetical protein